ncbi:thermonuclease family protein [Paenibacillus sp. sgz302251]|uniref:thermonuclease family protein n=1 Tax=Paenibacillus sp. sgz302251 TaxID=3414493 RepID=UPI003C7C8D8C
MKRNLILLLLLICLQLAGCSSFSLDELQANKWYPISSFVDGDTFKIQTGSEETTIRLLYVDTPETKKPNNPVEPFGPEASAYTKQLLSESGEVRLSFDKELKDRYDRTLAIVELKDGRILNELLLEQGFAKVLIVEPNVKMENVYKQIEQQAKQDKRGIWSITSEMADTTISIKNADYSGILIEVDKRGEMVTIINSTNEPITLDGWKLVSVRGNQTYKFIPYILKPEQEVIISSADEYDEYADNVLDWGSTNIWNNKESDPAELYNANNELMAVWED